MLFLGFLLLPDSLSEVHPLHTKSLMRPKTSSQKARAVSKSTGSFSEHAQGGGRGGGGGRQRPGRRAHGPPPSDSGVPNNQLRQPPVRAVSWVPGAGEVNSGKGTPNSDLPYLDHAGQNQSPASSCNPRRLWPRSHRLSFLCPVTGEPILQLLEAIPQPIHLLTVGSTL